MGAILPPIGLPPFIGNNSTPNAAASPAVGSTAYLNAVHIPRPLTITGVSVIVGNSAGSIDVGIYDNSGNRVASNGGGTCPAAGQRIINFSANANLSSGIYYIAMASTSITATFDRSGIDNNIGCSSFAGAYPLPTPLGLGTGVSSNRCFAMVGIVSGGVSI